MVKKNNPNILRKQEGKKKEVWLSISIKVKPKISYWLKQNNYSPTGIFIEAIKDLGFDEDKVELPEEEKQEETTKEFIEEVKEN